MKTLCLASSFVFALLAGAGSAFAQSGENAREMLGESVYRSFGYVTFVRGGIAFSNIVDDDTTLTAPYAAVGARRNIHRTGRAIFSLEGELLAGRQEVDAFNPDGAFLGDYGRWTYAALFGARADYALTRDLSAFVSGAAGPAYLESVDQVLDPDDDSVLVDAISSSFQAAYSGRAGVEAYLGEGFAVEAAYRYLGFTTNPTAGLHSAEISLGMRF